MLTIKQAKKTGFVAKVNGVNIMFIVSAAGHIYPIDRPTRNYRIVGGCSNDELVADVIAKYNTNSGSRPKIEFKDGV